MMKIQPQSASVRDKDPTNDSADLADWVDNQIRRTV